MKIKISTNATTFSFKKNSTSTYTKNPVGHSATWKVGKPTTLVSNMYKSPFTVNAEKQIVNVSPSDESILKSSSYTSTTVNSCIKTFYKVSSKAFNYKDPNYCCSLRIASINHSQLGRLIDIIHEINSYSYSYGFLCIVRLESDPENEELKSSYLYLLKVKVANLKKILKGFLPTTTVDTISLERVEILDPPPKVTNNPYKEYFSLFDKVFPEQTMWSQEMAGALKSSVVLALADSSIDSELCQLSLDEWAASSYTDESIGLQLAVADIFSIEKGEYFIKQHKAQNIKANRKHYLLAHKMYKNTQDLLAKKGIKKVFLYRGYTDTNRVDDLVAVRTPKLTSPLSSFSAHIKTAADYVITNFVIRANPIMQVQPHLLGSWFPAEAIFSTPLTGLGCNEESEFVVLGGQYTVYDDPVFEPIAEYLFSGYSFSDENLFRSFGDLERLSNKQDIEDILDSVDTVASYLGITRNMAIKMIQLRLPLRRVGQRWVLGSTRATSKPRSMSSSLIPNIDEDINNADWTKKSWDLPPFKSPLFFKYLKASGKTLEQFKTLPIYKNAVKRGLIKE